MWLRRFFSQDDAPEDAPETGQAPHEPVADRDGTDGTPHATGHVADGDVAGDDAVPSAVTTTTATPAVDVAAPPYAPQGLAAEPAEPSTTEPTGVDLTRSTVSAATDAPEVPATTPQAIPDAGPAPVAPVAPDGMHGAEAASSAELPGVAAREAGLATEADADAADVVQGSVAPSPAAPAPVAAPVTEGDTALPETSTGVLAAEDSAALEDAAAEAVSADDTIAATAGEAVVAGTATPAVPAPTEAEQVAPEAEQAAPGVGEALAPGMTVGDRYTITALAEMAGAPTDAVFVYHALDTRSYERCWSCGSADNGPGTRFCQTCGAPIQNHPVTLVQTDTATGLEGEVERDGAYFHVQPERRLFGAEGVGIEIGAYSAEGPHHPNEDSYWYVSSTICANSGRQSTAVVVLADGMGGYAPGSGLISSRIVATAGQYIAGSLGERASATGALDDGEVEAVVREGIAAANRVVIEEIARTGEMGATLVAVVIHGDTAYAANVGDSRAYYVAPQGAAAPITRDQSLVAQEVAQGTLAENDMYDAPGSNIILHAIGEDGVERSADWSIQRLEPGSYIIVCSDGYWKTMRGAVAADDVLHQSDTLTGVARRMVENALARGSDDNTTAILVAIN